MTTTSDSEQDRTHRLPCGHCDGYAEYKGGMIRVRDKPACQDCFEDLLGERSLDTGSDHGRAE